VFFHKSLLVTSARSASTGWSSEWPKTILLSRIRFFPLQDSAGVKSPAIYGPTFSSIVKGAKKFRFPRDCRLTINDINNHISIYILVFDGRCLPYPEKTPENPQAHSNEPSFFTFGSNPPVDHRSPEQDSAGRMFIMQRVRLAPGWRGVAGCLRTPGHRIRPSNQHETISQARAFLSYG